ncbi:DUF4179 domain-containing protein [Lederbergia graminis]|uniref:DUF4179 domain-containing protein n=1 Tax=Lederbergia graminis TaxID=735518 RepID=A0ABW0LKN2_9BACI
MYEQEEKKLTDFKNRLDEVSIPSDALDDAVMAGFYKAKKKKRPPYKIWLLQCAAAAILIIGFLASVRHSPTFANYISSIPGMEKIVEMIRDDKGLLAAVENEYYQKIGVSQEKNGLKVTIDGVIADEKGMMIFYTVESDNKEVKVTMLDARVKGENGEDLPAVISHGIPEESESNSYEGMVENFFQNEVEGKKFIWDVTLKEKNGFLEEHFQIPFTIPGDLKISKKIDVNQVVEVEGQRILFKTVTIYPTRVEIHTKFDSGNTKKILGLRDLRLVDEHGETWNRSTDIISTKISDDEITYYLQSNYFHEPKKLYIAMNEIEAIDKDEASVVVDIKNKKILKQPKGNVITEVDVNGEYIVFRIKANDFSSSVSFSEIKDADGNVIQSQGIYNRLDTGKGYIQIGEQISGLSEMKGPLIFEIGSFPSYIETNQKTRIK